MKKPLFYISCPYDTYSGYGARSRDIIKSIVKTNKYDVKLIPQRWGDTPWGFCDDHKEWKYLHDLVLPPTLNKTQPDVWMQITIPNEFQPAGKYNIGVTAGIEATVCKAEWVQGINRMNETWVSSKFSKQVFEQAKYKQQNQQTGQDMGILKVEKPIKVVFEGAKLDIYKKYNNGPKFDLKDIKESFCFLFVGHWMQGQHGHDRKNIGVLIKSFCDAFINKKNPPALILKVSRGTNSYANRESIKDHLKNYLKLYPSKNIPSIYILHGDLSDEEMNTLYNHHKIKAMVSLTKGEGFGRPLLEFSLVGKPILASGWSGHTDFLNPNFTKYLPGVLEEVHASAQNQWLIKEAKWFKVDEGMAKNSYIDVWKNYKPWKEKAKRQAYYSKTKFSWDKMHELITEILDELPEFPQQQELKLPKLKLPKLEKVKK